MSIISTIAGWFQSNGYYRLASMWGWNSAAASGEIVNLNSMMTLSTVWACSKVLGESFGSLPCHLIEETKSGKQKVVDDPLAEILHDRWNPYITAIQGREAMTIWASNAGNAVARIERADGKIKALWPYHPSEVEIEKIPRGLIFYEIQPNGKREKIPDAEVFHIANITGDGYIGLGIVDYAKNTIGNGLAAQKYAGKFFANGGRLPGIVKVAHTWKTDEEKKQFRSDWETTYGGPDNAHKNVILQGDVDFKPLGISPKDAQFVEWSAFSVPDVCRYYRVPPHMVMDLARATFSNIEHQGIEYVNYTLMPWIIRWEQRIQSALIDYDVAARIGRAGRRRYAKFNVDALMRGDFASRMAGYATAIQNGWVNIDEVREREDWNPLPNDAGKAHHIQLNMQTLPGTGKPTAAEATALAKVSTGGSSNGTGNQ